MAKFNVVYKDPEVYQSIEEAKNEVPAGDVERVCDHFNLGEDVVLEFDTVELTCRIVSKGSIVGNDKYYKKITEEWNAKKEKERDEISKWDALAAMPETPSLDSYRIQCPTLFNDEKWVQAEMKGTIGETIQRIPLKMARPRD